MRPDHYSLKARKLGYPARSVFKLQEIQKRFRIFHPGGSILDLGAAPGSWTLFSLQWLKNQGSVIAVDRNPLTINPPPHSKLRVWQGDIFALETTQFLSQGGPYHTILSDAAPSTTGNRLVDTRRSFDLVMRVIDLAQELQAPGGSLVVKVFQGGDEGELRKKIQDLYGETRTFKPQATRAGSLETYLIGRKYGKKISS